VFVVPGGANGVIPAQTVDFAGVDLAGQAPNSQLFAGSAMTTGQFGRGKTADLAVGIPSLMSGGNANAGGVAVLFGGAAGPSLTHLQRVDSDTVAGFPGDVNMFNGQALVGSARPLD
jgi:hypothetical protein